MNSAFYIVNQGALNNNSLLVDFGCVCNEPDATLPSYVSPTQTAYIQLTLDYGDGTTPLVLGPVHGPLQSSVVPSISASAGVTTIIYPKAAVGGSITFTNGIVLNYNTTTAQFNFAMNQLQTGAAVTGDPGDWVISGYSGSFAIASNNLIAAYDLGGHSYPVGKFTASLTANNYKVPSQVIKSTIQIVNKSMAPVANPPRVISPILPADQGFPNSHQWDFNLGQDVKVLVSAVKLILITEPGERVMMPEYGCALRQFVFNQGVADTAALVQAEVQRAITAWEPRVNVDRILATVEGKAIKVEAFLTSNLDSSKFKFITDVTR